MQLNYNLWYDRLVKPMDVLKRKEMMYQGGGTNVNGSAQTKKLWWIGFSFNASPRYNDFYEARSPGRVFRNTGSWSANLWYEGNAAKKYSGTVNLTAGGGGRLRRIKATHSSTSLRRIASPLTWAAGSFGALGASGIWMFGAVTGGSGVLPDCGSIGT